MDLSCRRSALDFVQNGSAIDAISGLLDADVVNADLGADTLGR